LIDIDTVRAQTPACNELTHFNNAGCSLMPVGVKDKLFEYLQSEQTIGGYETAEVYKAELSEMYQSVAKLISADADEIAYCESNTRGWQQFFYSLDFSNGGNIITTRGDYGSNFVSYIHVAKKYGVEIRYIETDDLGDLNLQNLEDQIDENTKLISVSHIPTGSGLINPAQSIGTIAARENIPYLLDACQSVGHLNIDVKNIQCTALTATGRKYLRGARGTGFLFVKRSYYENAQPVYLEQQSVNLVDDSHFEIHDSARRFENFESHFGGRLALKYAADYAHSIGTANIEGRVKKLANVCRSSLSSIAHVTVQDTGSEKCGIVTFTSTRKEPAEIRKLLLEFNINTWISSGSGSLIDFQDRGLDSVVRASLHYFNTETEIQRMCGLLSDMQKSD
jgi:cysteine desulfurase/selenocysteine lyase